MKRLVNIMFLATRVEIEDVIKMPKSPIIHFGYIDEFIVAPNVKVTTNINLLNLQ